MATHQHPLLFPEGFVWLSAALQQHQDPKLQWEQCDQQDASVEKEP